MGLSSLTIMESQNSIIIESVMKLGYYRVTKFSYPVTSVQLILDI